MNRFLNNKKIIITGASKGIGEACVKGCLEAGAVVIAVARSGELLQKIVEKNSSYKNQLEVMVADISQEKEVKILFEIVYEKHKAIDGLVQCAAQFHKSTLVNMSLDDWQNILNVNLTGAFLCIREAMQKMSRNGAIVNMGSLSGVPGVEKFEGFGVYNVSKYGLLGLTEIAAIEGRNKGIRVNSISPGAVDTAMLKQAAPELSPAMLPKEVSDICCFLLGDQSRAINGENIILYGHPDGPDGRCN